MVKIDNIELNWKDIGFNFIQARVKNLIICDIDLSNYRVRVNTIGGLYKPKDDFKTVDDAKAYCKKLCLKLLNEVLEK